ncbi:cupin domain-containing protein [Leptospira santarosai]|uniref:cupin domain-containing protein n=1 Tax=Leptospira santarosai TaxID=28183 RepID=UPI0024AE9335|nr:cupin domain-containing protein [Leptospira santarosai]MDI7174954.1 cupin domain-containing protein [Leptospira santarosai]MDI7194544.1 cupin domain-containing protein [Leptospira santarosai]MDO6399005.1 cupin domain-containing protein [Leptospira santarosai]MDO6404386.1 cupin domain-containing protein [Leptospira santarosai]
MTSKLEMILDRNDPSKFNNEYDVRVRRLAELLALTSPTKTALGAAISEFEPGETIREHINKPHVEEVFLLLDGIANFNLDGVVHQLNAGDLGFARIGQKHSFTNICDQKIRLLSIWWKVVNNEAHEIVTIPTIVNPDLIIDRNDPSKFNNEYDVRVRRLAELLALTSPTKTALGAAISEFEPGETIREHINKPHVEEVFLLLDGIANFNLDGVVHQLNAGDLGFARIGQKHSFTNICDQKIRLLSIWWKVPGREEGA